MIMGLRMTKIRYRKEHLNDYAYSTHYRYIIFGTNDGHRIQFSYDDFSNEHLHDLSEVFLYVYDLNGEEPDAEINIGIEGIQKLHEEFYKFLIKNIDVITIEKDTVYGYTTIYTSRDNFNNIILPQMECISE